MTTTALASDASLAQYCDEASRYPLLPRAEEIRLARLAQAGDEAARRRLVECNLRLVVAIARRYRGQGLDLTDLVQEGNLGLLAAAERYERPRELPFASFAAWWIRRAICRALSTTSRSIRVPIRVAERISALRRVEEELMQRLGRPPSAAELAREAGVAEDAIEDLRRAERRPASLSEPIGPDEDGTSLGDLILDESAADPAADVADAQRRAGVQDAVRALGERPRRVLELRYGIDGEERTLERVAGELGLSRERVRTIEAAALRQLSARPELDDLRVAA
jgi:RNA polymerase primary sigma factor